MKLSKYPLLGIIDKLKKTGKLNLPVVISTDPKEQALATTEFNTEYKKIVKEILSTETPYVASKSMQLAILDNEKFKFLSLPELLKASPINRGVYLMDTHLQIIYHCETDKCFLCIVIYNTIRIFFKGILGNDNIWKYQGQAHQYAQDFPDLYNALGHFHYLCMRFSIFKKFAPIETKIVEGNGKLKHAGIKYLNPNSLPVHVLDSNWYTTIMRTTPFGVSGHFRLQPCGVGLKDLKLIYIAPYVKKGYKRLAKKTHLQNESTIQ